MTRLTNKRRQLEDKIRLWARHHNYTTSFERVEKIDAIDFTYCVGDYFGHISIKPTTDVSEVWLTIKHNLERYFGCGHKPSVYIFDEGHCVIQIKKVIFNPPATIVLWNDGTKTVVKCDGEEFDPEKGLAMAISKKFLGNKGNYYNEFKKWLPKVWTNDDINSIYPESIKLDISAGCRDFNKRVRQMMNNIYGYKTLWPAKNPYIKHEDEIVEYCKKDVEVTQKLYEDMMSEKLEKIRMKACRLQNIIESWCADEELDIRCYGFWKNEGCFLLEVSSREFGKIFIRVKENSKIDKAFDYFRSEVIRKRKESPCED